MQDQGLFTPGTNVSHFPTMGTVIISSSTTNSLGAAARTQCIGLPCHYLFEIQPLSANRTVSNSNSIKPLFKEIQHSQAIGDGIHKLLVRSFTSEYESVLPCMCFFVHVVLTLVFPCCATGKQQHVNKPHVRVTQVLVCQAGTERMVCCYWTCWNN